MRWRSKNLSVAVMQRTYRYFLSRSWVWPWLRWQTRGQQCVKHKVTCSFRNTLWHALSLYTGILKFPFFTVYLSAKNFCPTPWKWKNPPPPPPGNVFWIMVLIYRQICSNNVGRISIISNYSWFILGTEHSEPLDLLTISHRKWLSSYECGTSPLLSSSR